LLQPAARMWPLGQIVQHIISVRAGWFSGTLQDDDEAMNQYLGGLLDYLSVEPSDPLAQSRAISITRGVFSNMVDAQGVMPYSFGFDIHSDPDDYSCGLGVFWRYLLRGFGQNAALRTELLKWVAADPENNEIYKSAENALSRTRPGNALFADFNILATLTATIEILQEADG
jgi:hypothetical protein